MNDILVLGIGVSQHMTDGVFRFKKFCDAFKLEHKIIGEGKIWCGGDMEAGMGGGQKINEIKQALESIDNRLLIICDTFDLFPVAFSDEIIHKYLDICPIDHVLFSSEVYCWPDDELKYHYPIVNTKYKYLNSGCIMGYRNNIYNLIKDTEIKNNDDDQLYFTKKFLAGEKIVLDYKCELFQALNGSTDDIIFHKNRIYNKYTDSYPIFIHGNGPSKIFLNHLENYIDVYPNKNMIKILKQPSLEPKIFFAMYVDSSQYNNMIYFLENSFKIKYTEKIVYVYDKYDNSEIKNMIESLGYIYKSNINEYDFEDFKKSDCEFYFLLEQKCIITNYDLLRLILPYCATNYRIISPLLISNTNNYFTNFWGDLDYNGYYKRSINYFQLVNQELRGLWNCPYIMGAILFKKDIILNWNIMASNIFKECGPDMQLCYNLRKYCLFMYMINFEIYGYVNN